MPKLTVREFLRAAKQVVPALEFTALMRETQGAEYVEVPPFKQFPSPGTVLKDGEREWKIRYFVFRHEPKRGYYFTPLVALSGALGAKVVPWTEVQDLQWR